jgi:uncharacterized protein with HEPN domain
LGRAAAEDPSLERQVPALRQVVGLRNRLIHGYDSIDDEIICALGPSWQYLCL